MTPRPKYATRGRIRRIAALCFVMAVLWSGMTTWSQRPRPALPRATDGLYRYAGGIHVHSRYSDGSGTVEEIVSAARRAGLDYVILTDHNDALPWTSAKAYEGYHDRMLLLVGEEANTGAGHLLTFGLDRPVEQHGPDGLPALLDTISAGGGLAFIAHPDGRRPWQDWTAAPVHGMELLNADTEWRNDSPFELLQALFWYPWMPEAALNTLIDRPDSAIVRWHEMALRGPATGIGSLDAHARIPLIGGLVIPFPSYERMFGLIRTYIVLDAPLTGDATADKARVLAALTAGRCYIGVDGFEPAVRFRFELIRENVAVRMGDGAVYGPENRIEAGAASSGSILIRLFRDGKPVADTMDGSLIYPAPAPGRYHAEVYQLRPWFPLNAPVPRLWVISNFITVEDGPIQTERLQSHGG